MSPIAWLRTNWDHTWVPTGLIAIVGLGAVALLWVLLPADYSVLGVPKGRVVAAGLTITTASIGTYRFFVVRRRLLSSEGEIADLRRSPGEKRFPSLVGFVGDLRAEIADVDPIGDNDLDEYLSWLDAEEVDGFLVALSVWLTDWTRHRDYVRRSALIGQSGSPDGPLSRWVKALPGLDGTEVRGRAAVELERAVRQGLLEPKPAGGVIPKDQEGEWFQITRKAVRLGRVGELYFSSQKANTPVTAPELMLLVKTDETLQI